MIKLRALLALSLSLPLLAACDPAHKEKCEWYLVPEPAHIDLVPEGWVSLCARNYVTNKQKCYLKSNIDFAKAVSGKSFRLTSLRVDDKGPYPREVLGIKSCAPEDEEKARLEKADRSTGGDSRSEEKSEDIE